MKEFLQPLIDFDDDLEGSVLGVCLLEPHAFGKVQHILIPECFFNPNHQRVFAVIAKLFEDGWPIDLLLVQRGFYDRGETQIGHSPTTYFLTQLMAGVVTSAHLEMWCLKLRELAIRRTAIAITTSGVDRSTDVLDMAGDIESKLKQLMDIRSVDDWEDAATVALRVTAQMEATAKGEGGGITTSLVELDDTNSGLKPGQLILIGARPGVGKSAFMGRMAVKVAKQGKAVGVITLEMDNTDVFKRMVSFDSNTPFWRMDKAEFADAEQHMEALRNIANTATLPIHFSERAQVNMKDIRAKAEKLKRKFNMEILFIDYLQLIEPDGSSKNMREQEVAKISRGCKLLAKTLGVPVVLMVQLNRQADGEEPQLKHLRESGSLEQDADIVFMLYRDIDTEDPVLKNEAKLFIRKWRNGTPFTIKLHFNGEHMRFSEAREIPPVYVERFENPSAGINGRTFKDITQPKSEQDDLPF